MQLTQYNRWAHDIAANPSAFPQISVEKALAAFAFWGVEPPVALHDRAVKLGLIKLPSNDA